MANTIRMTLTLMIYGGPLVLIATLADALL